MKYFGGSSYSWQARGTYMVHGTRYTVHGILNKSPLLSGAALDCPLRNDFFRFSRCRLLCYMGKQVPMDLLVTKPEVSVPFFSAPALGRSASFCAVAVRMCSEEHEAG